MRRALALAAFAVVLAVPATALGAAPTNAQLQAEIKTLQKKQAAQDKTIKKLRTDLDDAGGLAAAALVFSACGFAITSDAIQGVFAIEDQLAVATPTIAHTFYGVQAPISDQGTCTAFKLVRTQAVPPTTAAFSALLSLLRASSTAAAFDLLPGVLLR